jgi:hypothetical protein
MRDDDYEVGYGKPPRHTRFRPGQSGNPSGRPKGTRNLASDLSEELREKIIVTEGGKSRETTKQRAIVKTAVARALKGDMRAITVLIKQIEGMEQTTDNETQNELLSRDDEQILENFRRHLMEEIKAAEAGETDDQTT